MTRSWLLNCEKIVLDMWIFKGKDVGFLGIKM